MKDLRFATGIGTSGFTAAACLFLLTACASTAETDWQQKLVVILSTT
jgi:hypothetical protein